MLARSIEDATAEYARLERRLMLLTIVGIIVAAVASVLTAKRIAQPLRQLAGIARRLERGDYRAQTGFKRDDEIGALAKAFDSMRDGIAKREQEIRRLAYWDPLTNLPNRAQFVLLLNESLAEAKKREQPVFVLMMDLDRFKHVNDVMGHNFGDALLRQVAEPPAAAAGRTRMPTPTWRAWAATNSPCCCRAPTWHSAQVIAANILRALEQPLSLDDQTVDIGAGLGIAGYPLHGDDAEALLSMAEVAMYTAKQRNDGAVVYDADDRQVQRHQPVAADRTAQRHRAQRIPPARAAEDEARYRRSGRRRSRWCAGSIRCAATCSPTNSSRSPSRPALSACSRAGCSSSRPRCATTWPARAST